MIFTVTEEDGISTHLQMENMANLHLLIQKVTRLDRLKEDLHAKGISKRATELITNSYQQCSLTYYKSTGAKWSSWCIGRKIYLIRLLLSCNLDFLAELFEGCLDYNTVGSYRSAISVSHNPIDGQKVEEHPRVSGLMAAILHQRPL